MHRALNGLLASRSSDNMWGSDPHDDDSLALTSAPHGTSSLERGGILGILEYKFRRPQ
jgi:hypothetical protein